MSIETQPNKTQNNHEDIQRNQIVKKWRDDLKLSLNDIDLNSENLENLDLDLIIPQLVLSNLDEALQLNDSLAEQDKYDYFQNLILRYARRKDMPKVRSFIDTLESEIDRNWYNAALIAAQPYKDPDKALGNTQQLLSQNQNLITNLNQQEQNQKTIDDLYKVVDCQSLLINQEELIILYNLILAFLNGTENTDQQISEIKEKWAKFEVEFDDDSEETGIYNFFFDILSTKILQIVQQWTNNKTSHFAELCEILGIENLDCIILESRESVKLPESFQRVIYGLIIPIDEDWVKSVYLDNLALIAEPNLLIEIIDEAETFDQEFRDKVMVGTVGNLARQRNLDQAMNIINSMDTELLDYQRAKGLLAIEYAKKGLDASAFDLAYQIQDPETKSQVIENMAIIQMNRNQREFVNNFPVSISQFIPHLNQLRLLNITKDKGVYLSTQETEFSKQSFYALLLESLIEQNCLIEASDLLTKIENELDPYWTTKIKIEAVRKSMEAELAFKD